MGDNHRNREHELEIELAKKESDKSMLIGCLIVGAIFFVIFCLAIGSASRNTSPTTPEEDQYYIDQQNSGRY